MNQSKTNQGQAPSEELGVNEVNNRKLGGSFENNDQVRHTVHDGARPGLERNDSAERASEAERTGVDQGNTDSA
jgi:hypothetical protein